MLSPSGGIVYHLRALSQRLRFRGLSQGDLWQGTRGSASSELKAFLNRNRIRTLLLIGPSGGYLIDPTIFRETIVQQLFVSEPDRLARLIFRWRFRKSRTGIRAITFDDRIDRIPFFRRGSGEELRQEFAEFQRTNGGPLGVVFWGVLGQIALHRSEWTCTAHEGAEQVRLMLEGIPWASLHDSLSARLYPSLSHRPATTPPLQFETGLSARAHEIAELNSMSHTATDHETDWIDQHGPVTAFCWPLSASRLHWCHWYASS